MKKIKLVILIISLLSTVVMGSASEPIEIDLSSLSAGNEVSHNHIWESKYDSGNHWDGCLICKGKQNIKSHSLSVKYTVSQTSCSTNNYKITQCSGCEYNTRQLSQGAHVYKSIVHWYNPTSGKKYITSVCNNCSGHYNTTLNGNKYYYSNNTAVDPDNLILPATIKDGLGHTATLRTKVNKVTTDYTGYNVNYSISNSGEYRTVTVTSVLNVPAEITAKFTDSQLSQTAYVNCQLWVYDLANGNENKGYTVTPSSQTYNASTKQITTKYSFQTKSSLKNYMAPGRFRSETIFFEYDSNNCTARTYYMSEFTYLSLNLTTPLISSVSS